MTAALVRIEGTSAASPARRIAGFARLLRGRGFPVGIAESMDALRVLKSIGTGDAPGFKLSLRALFCTCEADWRRFDELNDEEHVDGHDEQREHAGDREEERRGGKAAHDLPRGCKVEHGQHRKGQLPRARERGSDSPTLGARPGRRSARARE